MDGGGAAPTTLQAAARLAAELADLKRVTDARGPDSLATRGFRTAWARLVAGEEAASVADDVTAAALVASRLGGIDWPVLQGADVAGPGLVLERAYDEAAGRLGSGVRTRLRPHAGLQHASWPATVPAGLPPFVGALAAQPRAGATCPGKPRLVLHPFESHADHCLLVAVLGVVLADTYGADPALVFVAGLAHHLHNAWLPDSGFAGEVLLGGELEPLIARLFAREIATLPPEPAALVRRALDTIPDAATPEGRAFHAADVIDRVLQMVHYERVAAFTARQALEDLELVHAGPVQAFHHSVLAAACLA